MTEPNKCDANIKSIPLPEGCVLTKAIRDARFRIAHITRDIHGNYSERYGWLVTDVVCSDPTRICIQYDKSSVYMDVPSIEVVIMSCTQGTDISTHRTSTDRGFP